MKKTPQLKGKKIFHQAGDELTIDVYENRYYRWMTFGNSNIQTAISKHQPSDAVLNYIPAIALMAGSVSENGTALLLGLGGGGLIHYLRPRHPYLNLSAVEIEAEIIDIAKRYFQYSEDALSHTAHDDARAFLEKSTQQYDTILCDIYTSQDYPEHCFATDFFQLCSDHLTKNGSLSINIIADETNQIHQLIAMIKSVFDEQTVIIPIKGQSNIVIHAFKQRNSLKKLLKASDKLKKVIWDAEWGMMAEI